VTAPLPPAPGAQPDRATHEAAVRQCAEADRLAAVARQRADELREAKRRRADLQWTGQSENELADRRTLRDAKLAAQRAYHEQRSVARDAPAMTLAAANWLGEITRLNQAARLAASRQARLNHETAALDALVRRLELQADAARIAAATAREGCLEARRQVATFQEDGGQRAAGQTAGASRADVAPPHLAAGAGAVAGTGPYGSHEPAVVGLLNGDRQMLQAVVARLAEEIGQDAGRLQLLMLELGDAIIDVARDACAFDFPARHPFWGQFSHGEARAVAASLATFGRAFDGRAGWANGVAPNQRELAMAISLAGRDPRSVRRSPTTAEIETLWDGATIAAAHHLLSQAPDLRLEAIVSLLGRRAEGLGELWDNWGHLRLLLLGSDSSLAS